MYMQDTAHLNGDKGEQLAEGEMQDVSGLLESRGGEGGGRGKGLLTEEMEASITRALVAVEDLIEVLRYAEGKKRPSYVVKET